MRMNMKWITLLGIMLLAAQAFGGEQQVLNSQKDKENYSTGVEFVRNLKQQGGAVDLDIVIQGIRDGLTGERLLMTESEIRATMAARHSGMAGQREAMKAVETDGTAPKTMSADRAEPSATPKKQEPAKPRTEESEQNAQLASRQFSSGAAAGMGQFLPNQQNIPPAAPLSPNGTVISKRNQAKLSVTEMKREVRAAAFASGGAGQ